MFLTNKTNNIGEKEFSFNDISNSFKSNSSVFFRNNFSSFFSKDDLLKNSFDSNTSVTLRKEDKKFRLGFVLYYNNMNQRKNTYQTTEKNNLLFKREEKSIFNTGQSVVSRFLINRSLDKNTVLSYKFDLIYSNTKDSNTLNTYNILPEEVNIEEENKNIPKSFLYSTKIRLKKMINNRTIISTGFEYNRENSENYFETNYKIIDYDNFNQFFSFTNQSSKLDVTLDYKINNYFTTSIGSESILIKDKLKYKNNNIRKGYISNIILQLRGQNKKLEYKLKLVPQFYYLQENKNKFETSTSISYKLNESNRINVNYSQNNNFIDIDKSLDTLALSYNKRLINTKFVKDEISTTKSFNLGYNYSSIIKTQSFNLGYSYVEDFNYLEPILGTIENNIFYYKNHLIDKKSTSRFTINAGKGFYFSKKYHLLKINSGFVNNRSKFPVFELGEKKEYIVQNYSYRAKIGIEPKFFVVDEMYLEARINDQNIFLNDQNININNSYIYHITLSKKTDSKELNLSLGQSIQKNEETVFKTPFLNIDGTLKINEKLNIFVKGKYLFHLFNYKNTDLTSFNISSNGNYIFNSYNKNNLNYLIFGISYKL